jgi:multidrug efflux pump subunit AcrA (membrane-fusion protein)
MAPRPRWPQAEAEFTRQETLLRQNVSAQATYDTAKAKRDNARANVENAEGNLTVAQTNLGYTTVLAPFDGIVSKHLVSVGELVGATTATKLATIVQLDPIYVTFNMSEQDVLQVRQNLKDRRLDVEELSKVPLEIGLMNEDGFPHKGFLNYVSPELDATTGTILVRGLFNNPTRSLIPGFFVRVKVPQGLGATASLLVPQSRDRRGSGRQVPADGQQGQCRGPDPDHHRTASRQWPARDPDGPEAGRPGRAQHQRRGNSRRQGGSQGDDNFRCDRRRSRRSQVTGRGTQP